MFARFLSNQGASLVEVIVAAGMVGAVSLGVMKVTETGQKQSLFSLQNFQMDNYIRGLGKHIASKDQCDLVLQPTAGGGIAPPNLSSFPIDGDSKISVSTARILLPQRDPSVAREVLPISLYVHFDRNLAENFQSGINKPVRKVTASGVFTNGDFSECTNYELEAERSAFKLACEVLGGVEVILPDDSQDCDFSAIPANYQFLERTKQRVCERVYAGTYVAGKCNNFDMPSANFFGQNLGVNNYLINGATVSTFRQMCSGENNFVVGINSDGSVICKTINRCTRGDTNCPL